MSKYSFETVYKIWDDTSGSHVEVGPDSDGLDLVQLRCVDPDGSRVTPPLVFTPAEALMIAEALKRSAEGFLQKETKTVANCDYCGSALDGYGHCTGLISPRCS